MLKHKGIASKVMLCYSVSFIAIQFIGLDSGSNKSKTHQAYVFGFVLDHERKKLI